MPRTNRPLRVHFLPPPDGLAHDAGTAVVVDVLRASTTMTTALHHGAAGILPCLTPEEARTTATSRGALLGGERRGVRIDGFDFGNSPAEYKPDRVRGRMVAFTTTNGTRAIHQSMNAANVIVGSFVNLKAVTDFCRHADGSIDIVCAGTDGHVTGEDVLFAGALARQLGDLDDITIENDAAEIAADYAAGKYVTDPDRLAAMRSARGGRNLVRIGLESDIALAAEMDRFPIVPKYDAATRTITIARED